MEHHFDLYCSVPWILHRRVHTAVEVAKYGNRRKWPGSVCGQQECFADTVEYPPNFFFQKSGSGIDKGTRKGRGYVLLKVCR